MTDQPNALLEAQDDRRAALIERIGTFADILSSSPLPGESGDVAYDLLRQAAAQISGDRQKIAALSRPAQPSGEAVLLQYGASYSQGFSLAADEVRAAHAHLDERGASKYWDVGDGKLHPMSLAERIGSILTTPAREAIEAAAVAARDAMVAMEWPPQDGDKQIEEVMAAIRALALPSNPGEPDAWMYEREGHVAAMRYRAADTSIFKRQPGWTETPLYRHPPAASGGEVEVWQCLTLDEAWKDLVEKDDRTSPEEYPDMCLITRHELDEYMMAAVAQHRLMSTHAGNGGQSATIPRCITDTKFSAQRGQSGEPAGIRHPITGEPI